MSRAIEIILLVVMVVGLVGLLYDRIKFKKGIGVRAIQFLSVVLVVPGIMILALQRVLNSATIGTLFGAIIGYILSGIGKDEPNKQ